MKLPRYPVYVPSKGRYATPYTARFLMKDGVPFRMVVEPQEHDDYAEVVGEERVLVLPKNNQGLIYSRNWIKGHATAEGHERHWQLDDNIRKVRRWYKGKRIPCRSGVAMGVTEDFVDRYENVAVAGLNYTMFCVPRLNMPPFYRNVHVYSYTLVMNSLPNRWRLRYNDDTDLCLQVLADGWCTILMNAFMCDKIWTGVVKGGNTDDLYQGDGRAVMARSLESRWPYIVETKRRFQRPQHVVRDQWRKFDTPLKRRKDVDWDALGDVDEFGMGLKQVKEIQSESIQKLLDDAKATGSSPP